VTVWSGETRTITAQKAIARITPTASAPPLRRISDASKVARAKPSPMMGSIKGEISIAPITTAGEDNSNPRTAMPADRRVITAKCADQPPSPRTLATTARWSIPETACVDHQ